MQKHKLQIIVTSCYDKIKIDQTIFKNISSGRQKDTPQLFFGKSLNSLAILACIYLLN